MGALLLRPALAAGAAGAGAAAGGAAAVVPRGEGVTTGRFVGCWAPELGLTPERCCADPGGGAGGCFDGYYTAERCCAPARRAHGPPPPSRCLWALRSALLHCAQSACGDAADAAPCDELIETGRCAARCRALPAGRGASVTRSSGLGRALWCLARRPEVSAALDLFVAEGDGSSTLLAHGLRSAPGRGAPLLFGFERAPEALAAAARWLGALPGVRLSLLRLTGGETAEELLALARGAAAEAARAARGGAAEAPLPALLIAGEPVADGGRAPEERLRAPGRGGAGGGALRALCAELRVDLVFLDPAFSAADEEFAIILEHCRPLRWVVVNNINLPGFAGWVREHLLALPDWAEVLSGRTADPWAAGADQSSGPLPSVYRVRVWTALARISEVCAPNATAAAAAA